MLVVTDSLPITMISLALINLARFQVSDMETFIEHVLGPVRELLVTNKVTV